jgi:hypothetical protein
MKRIFEQDDQEFKNNPSVNAEYDINVIPTEVAVDDVIKALDDINNYGIYISNMRNSPVVNQGIEKYFGNMDADGKKISPAGKASIEKSTGKKFPVKTKDAIDAITMSLISKPNLLKYEVKGNNVVFPQKGNPTKEVTKRIIKTVLGNAGIKYKVKEVELAESKTIKFLDILREEVTETGLTLDLSNKIYNALTNEIPEIKKQFPLKSAFYFFLNDKL